MKARLEKMESDLRKLGYVEDVVVHNLSARVDVERMGPEVKALMEGLGRERCFMVDVTCSWRKDYEDGISGVVRSTLSTEDLIVRTHAYGYGIIVTVPKV